jgi:hypothetical protein
LAGAAGRPTAPSSGFFAWNRSTDFAPWASPQVVDDTQPFSILRMETEWNW